MAADEAARPSGVQNYYAGTALAGGYAHDRPSAHALVVGLAKRCLGDRKALRALDVACGTGHSSLALLEVAERVTGLDESEEMLSAAARHPLVTYVAGRAEQLPFPDASFGLVSAASAYHWFDHHGFLREAARVLEPGGRLLVFNSGSTGRPPADAPDRTAFDKWFEGVFLVRFPTVPRHSNSMTAEEVQPHGLRLLCAETFTHEMEHTAGSYAALLMTRSNLLRAVAAGEVSSPHAVAWIEEGLRPFFPPDGNTRRTLVHQGSFQVAAKPVDDSR